MINHREPQFPWEVIVLALLISHGCCDCWASQVTLAVKKLPANAEDERVAGSVPGLGRPPGGGHGKPLQCSYLENPMDRRAWWATVHSISKSQDTGSRRRTVSKSWTRLKWLSMHTQEDSEITLKYKLLMAQCDYQWWSGESQCPKEVIGASGERKEKR